MEHPNKKHQHAIKANGIILMALLSATAFYISELKAVKNLQINPLIVGIILGMIFANTLSSRLPKAYVPGINFCTKEILRLSIIFYGFRLTLGQLHELGATAITIDIIMVTSVTLLGLTVGKLLKMDRDLTILTSAGSAICGAAAVLGTEPVLKAETHKTAVAVSTVVIFGTISMFLYPTLYRMNIVFTDAKQMGLYTGSTLHEVAHVVGAGNAMGNPEISNAAIITKMIRVTLLAPFLLIISWLIRHKQSEKSKRTKEKISIPWFAIWFLITIGVNTIINFCCRQWGLTNAYNATINTINQADTFGLTMAMTALGTQTSFDKFKQAGAKPFLLALVLFVWLVVGGYCVNKYVPMLF